jgi:hypothetical protein
MQTIEDMFELVLILFTTSGTPTEEASSLVAVWVLRGGSVSDVIGKRRGTSVLEPNRYESAAMQYTPGMKSS